MLSSALGVLNERERRIFEARRLSDEPLTLEDLSANSTFPANGCGRSRFARSKGAGCGESRRQAPDAGARTIEAVPA